EREVHGRVRDPDARRDLVAGQPLPVGLLLDLWLRERWERPGREARLGAAGPGDGGDQDRSQDEGDAHHDLRSFRSGWYTLVPRCSLRFAFCLEMSPTGPRIAVDAGAARR